MSSVEWESLCDGCARCCLEKLEDEDTGQIYFTHVSCKLLDAGLCACKDYAHRSDQVPDCVRLTPANVRTLNWLPPSCGYKLVAEGRDLYWWHPLVSGDPDTVHEAGISVRGECRLEVVRYLRPLAVLESADQDWVAGFEGVDADAFHLDLEQRRKAPPFTISRRRDVRNRQAFAGLVPVTVRGKQPSRLIEPPSYAYTWHRAGLTGSVAAISTCTWTSRSSSSASPRCVRGTCSRCEC